MKASDIRQAIWRLVLNGATVLTNSVQGARRGRVLQQLRALERERIVETGHQPCRCPRGYRITAKLHKTKTMFQRPQKKLH
jgi:hypothetical protein